MTSGPDLPAANRQARHPRSHHNLEDPVTQQTEPTADQALRERIKAALTAAVVLPGKVPDAEEQVVLDDLTDAVLPLFAEEREAGMRNGADWLIAEYPGPHADRAVRRAADRLRACATTPSAGPVAAGDLPGVAS